SRVLRSSSKQKLSGYIYIGRITTTRLASLTCAVCIAFLGSIGVTFKASAVDTVWLDWVSFCSSNQSAIVTEGNLKGKSPQDVKGLEIHDTLLPKCVEWGQSFSNLIDLRITSERSDPVFELISAATNFPKLQYLHLEIREAKQISSSIVLLTNLPD